MYAQFIALYTFMLHHLILSLQCVSSRLPAACSPVLLLHPERLSPLLHHSPDACSPEPVPPPAHQIPRRQLPGTSDIHTRDPRLQRLLAHCFACVLDVRILQKHPLQRGGGGRGGRSPFDAR